MSQPLWKALNVLQAAADADFVRQRKLHVGRFQCRVGCDACCRTPFVISEAEAASVSQAVALLPPQLVAGLKRRAAEYLPRRLAVLSAYGYRQSRGELAPQAEQVACPALVNGRCAVYRHRPTLCRRFGAALLGPDESDRVFACQHNFSPGERVVDPDLIPGQQELARLAREVSQEYAQAGGQLYREPLTVAHAVLMDFRP